MNAAWGGRGRRGWGRRSRNRNRGRGGRPNAIEAKRERVREPERKRGRGREGEEKERRGRSAKHKVAWDGPTENAPPFLLLLSSPLSFPRPLPPAPCPWLLPIAPCPTVPCLLPIPRPQPPRTRAKKEGVGKSGAEGRGARAPPCRCAQRRSWSFCAGIARASPARPWGAGRSTWPAGARRRRRAR